MATKFLGELESRAPELLPWAPLIAMAIGVSVPETPESRDLEEEFRRPRLARAVIDLLAVSCPTADCSSSRTRTTWTRPRPTSSAIWR